MIAGVAVWPMNGIERRAPTSVAEKTRLPACAEDFSSAQSSGGNGAPAKPQKRGLRPLGCGKAMSTAVVRAVGLQPVDHARVVAARERPARVQLVLALG